MICDVERLGCIKHCGHVYLNLIAMQTGTHVITFDWLGTWHTIEFYAIKGKRMGFSNKFNESANTKFQITQPDGSSYRANIESLGISCDDCPRWFSINTRITRKAKELTDISELFGCKADDICLTFLC